MVEEAIKLSPALEAKRARLAGFAYRLAIIKADDLGSEASMDCWWRLMDALDRRGVPISIGVIANRMAQKSQSDLARWAVVLKEGAHEVWNHSHTHADFAKLTHEEQAHELALSQPVIEDALKIRPSVFGAPFNSMNLETLRAVEENGDFRAIYFATGETSLQTIPLPNMCPPEYIRRYYGQPDFRMFLPRYELRKVKQPMVLQVHPPRWSQHGLVEFLRIVDWMLEETWQFVTFEDLMAYWAGPSTPPAPDRYRVRLIRAGEHFTHAFAVQVGQTGGDSWSDYNLDRYTQGTIHIRRFLESSGMGILPDTRTQEPVTCLDIGCGSGNWSIAYAELSPQHRVVGMDNDARLASVLDEAVQTGELAGKVTFRRGSILDIPVEENEFGHIICHNLLNYVPLNESLAELKRVMHPNGRMLIGLQNRHFWLRGYYDGLRGANRNVALRRIDQLGFRGARSVGLPPGGNYGWIHSDEAFLLHAELFGLQQQLPPMVDAERQGSFLGTQLFSYYILEQRSVPSDPGNVFVSGRESVPELDRVAELFVAGSWRTFLTVVESLCRRGNRIEDRRIRRMVAVATVLANDAGFQVGEACKKIAEGHDRVATACAAYFRREYAQAASHFVAAAAEDRETALMAVMAYYAAGEFVTALNVCDKFLPPRDEWSENEWMVWLTANTASRGVDVGRIEFRSYLQQLLHVLEKQIGESDLHVMTRQKALKESVTTDMITLASFRAVISSLV